MEINSQEANIQPAPLTIVIDPVTGIILAASPGIERILGIEASALTGKHLSVLSAAQGDPNEDIARFVAAAGHDLVSPLNQASTLAGLFLRKYRGDFDDDAAELVKHMESSAGSGDTWMWARLRAR